MAVFEHYLKRLSQRGWGLFTIVESDPATARARVHLHNSSFVLAQPDEKGKLCYMFAGWFAGAMDWVNDTAADGVKKGPPSFSVETQCAAEDHAHCVFKVSPLAS
jgi:predicted hydrocarbon binding protein